LVNTKVLKKLSLT